jgi:tRNA(fMet)-specific endonuclease VapC
MSVVVLDTNLVSFRMKGHTIAAMYRQHLKAQRLAISFMTVAELYEGAHRKGWDSSKMAWLEEEIRQYRVIHTTMRIVQCWGEIRAGRYRQPISVDDAWIAATALANGWPLVTHNPADFRDIEGLQVITECVDAE